jgi:hypothetical protein
MRGSIPTVGMALDNIELAETFLRLEKEGDPGIAAMMLRAGPEKWAAFVAANEAVVEASRTWPPVAGQPVPSELWNSVTVQSSAFSRIGCLRMILAHPVIRPMVDRETSLCWI